jgi:hypothetical protein
MKPVLIAGITIVNLALLSYATAVVIQSRKKVLTRNVLTFLTLGVVLDITSTICMIVSSGHAFTLHGIIGYTSLAGMLTDTLISFRHTCKYGLKSPLSISFNRWTMAAFFYWIMAYITGVLIILTRD